MLNDKPIRSLSEGELEQLRVFASSPDAAAIMERSNAADQVRRAALVKKLAALPSEHEKRLALSATVRAKAEVRFNTARDEYSAALAHLSAATIASSGAQFAAESELAAIEAELRETADRRLAQMIDHCYRLHQRARHCTRAESYKDADNKLAWVTNIGEVHAAVAELGRVVAACQEAQLKPLKRNEVTDLLAGLLFDLEAVLAPLELIRDIPVLDEFGSLTDSKTVQEH